jgi:hypothetical protein
MGRMLVIWRRRAEDLWCKPGKLKGIVALGQASLRSYGKFVMLGPHGFCVHLGELGSPKE